MKKEPYGQTLSKLLLKGISLNRAIQLAAEQNPTGYKVYLEEIFNRGKHGQKEKK